MRRIRRKWNLIQTANINTLTHTHREKNMLIQREEYAGRTTTTPFSQEREKGVAENADTERERERSSVEKEAVCE